MTEIYYTDLPSTRSGNEHFKTIENLIPNTTYYWKVVAVNPQVFNTESKVKSFTLQ